MSDARQCFSSTALMDYLLGQDSKGFSCCRGFNVEFLGRVLGGGFSTCVVLAALGVSFLFRSH